METKRDGALPAIVSFIGWHNSGKTTVATRVVAELLRRERRVAVVKSTKESGCVADTPGTDTAAYQQVGVPVLLAAADGFVLRRQMSAKPELKELARRWFADMELVVGEGFKGETDIAKIEVCRGDDHRSSEVSGVVATVGGTPLPGERSFSGEDVSGIADFIEEISFGCLK